MTGAHGSRRSGRAPAALWVGGVLFLLVVAYLVTSSLVRPEIASFEPSPVVPGAEADALVVGTYTIDARHPEAWVFFDFSRGSVVSDPGSLEWDLAVRRYHLALNGGEAFAGEAGAVALDEEWGRVVEAPADGYAATIGSLGGQPTHPALGRWYRYSFFAHTLESLGRVYAVRTADGRYAKLRIVSYYCPEATPGCVTFEYAYQGDGSRRLVR